MIQYFFRILKGATALGQTLAVSNGYEAVAYIPKDPGLEPHSQMQFSVIPRVFVEEVQSSYRPILQRQTTKWT